MKKKIARFVRRARRGLGLEKLSAGQQAHHGDVARDSGDWSKARGLYQAALAADPTIEHIWVQLGHAHKVMGDLPLAERAYRSALDLNPDNHDTLLQLGHLLKDLKRINEAGECYAASLALDDLNVDARQALEGLGHERRVHARQKRPGPSAATSFDLAKIGPGGILIDVTAASDIGPDVLSALVSRLSVPDLPNVSFARWTDSGWFDLGGKPTPIDRTYYSTAIVWGPWLRFRRKHLEALRHLAIYEGLAIVGGVLDLAPLLHPDLLEEDARSGASRYMAFLQQFASGIVALEIFGMGEVRRLVSYITPQVAAIGGPLEPSEGMGFDRNGPIALIGSPGTAALEEAVAAAHRVALNGSAKFQVGLMEEKDGIRIGLAGAVLLASDLRSLLAAEMLRAGGIPIALTPQVRASPFIDVATHIVPLVPAERATEQLEEFARACRSDAEPTLAATSRRGGQGLAQEISNWRRRRLDLSQGLLLLTDDSGDRAFHSALSLFPESLDQLSANGLTLTAQPAFLGLTGKQPSIVAALVAAGADGVRIELGTGEPGQLTVQDLPANGVAWIRVDTSGKGSAKLSLGVSHASRDSGSSNCRLLATYHYPAGRHDRWLHFLDQVSRGHYGPLRSLTADLLSRTN